MRLINTDTLQLEEFASPPEYAILSHAWEEQETSYQDFQTPAKRERQAGFNKIRMAALHARNMGLAYIWVDTCCIDKTSSAELSEAINSMFRWYRDAVVCYAYLADVPKCDDSSAGGLKFADSRWFTRGWTLQELIAPSRVEFYGAEWTGLGDKASLASEIHEITRVDEGVLCGESLQNISVARRMSWAANRQTTREEDIAYCLMGIFDVNMPLLYGEGPKSFVRLQEEILRQIPDETLFAWTATESSAQAAPYRGLLATSPAEFRDSSGYVPFQDITASPSQLSITSRGVLLTGTMKVVNRGPKKVIRLGLRCGPPHNAKSALAIDLACRGGDQYVRQTPGRLFSLEQSLMTAPTAVYVAKSLQASAVDILPYFHWQNGVHFTRLPPELEVRGLIPATAPWDSKDHIIPQASFVNGVVGLKMVCPWSKRCVLLVIWAVAGQGLIHKFELQAVEVDESSVDQAFSQVEKPAEQAEPVEGPNRIVLLLKPHFLVVSGRLGKVWGCDMFCVSILHVENKDAYERLAPTMSPTASNCKVM
jgi:hypothetical protein